MYTNYVSGLNYTFIAEIRSDVDVMNNLNNKEYLLSAITSVQ